MSYTLSQIQVYLEENKSLVLGTVDKNGNPQLRHLGGYGIEGLDIYFHTTVGSAKTKEITENPQVIALFQHEGQQVPKNVTLFGKAERLTGDRVNSGVEIIRKRRPQVNYNPETSEVYKIKTDAIKVLDFASDTKQEVIKVADLVI